MFLKVEICIMILQLQYTLYWCYVIGRGSCRTSSSTTNYMDNGPLIVAALWLMHTRNSKASFLCVIRCTENIFY